MSVNIHFLLNEEWISTQKPLPSFLVLGDLRSVFAPQFVRFEEAIERSVSGPSEPVSEEALEQRIAVPAGPISIGLIQDGFDILAPDKMVSYSWLNDNDRVIVFAASEERIEIKAFHAQRSLQKCEVSCPDGKSGQGCVDCDFEGYTITVCC